MLVAYKFLNKDASSSIVRECGFTRPTAAGWDFLGISFLKIVIKISNIF